MGLYVLVGEVDFFYFDCALFLMKMGTFLTSILFGNLVESSSESQNIALNTIKLRSLKVRGTLVLLR